MFEIFARHWQLHILLKERKIRMCVFLYDVKGNSNHSVILKKERLSFYGPLYSYPMVTLV